MTGSPKIVPAVPRPPSPPPAATPRDTGMAKPVFQPVSRPTAPPVAPRPASPRAGPSETAATDGTVLFPGLRTPRIEATICEKMPDGSTGKPVAVQKETTIGREGCDLNYSEDVLLSPRHASLTIREGKLYLKDLGSNNGTFIRQRQDTELSPGDIFLLGQGLFRFTTQSLDETQNQPSPQGTMVWDAAPRLLRGPLTAKLEQIKLTGEVVAEFRLDKPETTLGRTTGDMVFKDDKYMSGSHARIVAQPGRFILQDLRSRNGIYRRLRQEIELQDRDEFFMGERIFRVEIKPLD